MEMKRLLRARKHISRSRDSTTPPLLFTAGITIIICFPTRGTTTTARPFFTSIIRVIGNNSIRWLLYLRRGSRVHSGLIFLSRCGRGAKHPVQQSPLAGETPALTSCQVDSSEVELCLSTVDRNCTRLGYYVGGGWIEASKSRRTASTPKKVIISCLSV